ncbi:MAG: polysaccharide deacetylase family protein [Thermoguttaceae bacterium]|jgi:peptidoglycan/xylan/chitin deacetylase (PgdA/CDA1 family)
MNENIKSIKELSIHPPCKRAAGVGGGVFSRSFWLRAIPRGFADRAAVPMHFIFGNRYRNCFGILMYHRISPLTPGVPAPTWNVTPERFRIQMQGLLAKGFKPWPLRKAIDHHNKGLPIPRNAFVVTFDDGYECVHGNAWPILKELRIPATVFVVTSMLDSKAPMPFEDWQAAGSPLVPASAWQCISIRQCREMLADGLIELGGHTHWHEDYRHRPEAFSSDLSASIQAMRQWFGERETPFAYPFGYADAELASIAKTSGMICGLTADKELIKPQTDLFAWGRLIAEQYDTASTLAAKLSGWYSTIYGFLHGLQRFRQETSAHAAVNCDGTKTPMRQATFHQ